MRYLTDAFLSICIIAAVCSVTSASTITVPDDFDKIQDAIDDSSTVDGDTILIEAGTYNEHDLDTGSKQLTFTGETHADGSPAVTIDAQGVGRVWHIDNTNETVTLQNLVITGGSTTAFGGGIYCNGPHTITNCHVQNNTAGRGGGIYFDSGGTPTITDSVVTDNTATDGADEIDGGGGIYCRDCGPLIERCEVTSNDATGTSAAGGGIHCNNGMGSTPNLRINDCTIASNTTGGDGGGVFLNAFADAAIQRSDVNNNTATLGDGGGICLIDTSTLTASDTEIHDNTAGDDGGGVGMRINRSSSFTTCLIHDNSATNFGGGIDCWQSGSSFTVTDCHVTDNTSGVGGGISCRETSSSGATISISGCVIDANTSNNPTGDGGGGIYSHDNTTPTISDCAITRNTTSGKGGGVSCTDNPAISDCTISMNAGVDGGGVGAWGGGTPDLDGCMIHDNTASNDGGGVYALFGSIDGCDVRSNSSGGGDDSGCGLFLSSGNIVTMGSTLVCSNTGCDEQIEGEFQDNGGNTISDECPPECPDANGDGDTDLDDLILVIDAWGTPDINSDFDGDGVVGIHDLLDLLEAWGSCGS